MGLGPREPDRDILRKEGFTDIWSDVIRAKFKKTLQMGRWRGPGEGGRFARRRLYHQESVQRQKLQDVVNWAQGKKRIQNPGFLQTKKLVVTEKVTQEDGKGI